MTRHANKSFADRMSRFFDAAGVVAVSIRSAKAQGGPSPMECVGQALGRTALMLTVVVGAGAYGAIEHRMSDDFLKVPLEQGILEVAASISPRSFPTALAELQRRGAASGNAPVASDHRLSLTEEAITWFEDEGIMTLGVQEALSRWGAYAHRDHYHIEEIPAASEELQPSPWALRSLIESVALQTDMTAREAAESLDRELLNFMISSDLCEAGSDADCIARVTNIANGELVLEMDARSGEIGARAQVHAGEDTPEGMRF